MLGDEYIIPCTCGKSLRRKDDVLRGRIILQHGDNPEAVRIITEREWYDLYVNDEVESKVQEWLDRIHEYEQE